MKNIVKQRNGYQVVKTSNYKQQYFGRYPALETARRVRDELEKVNWNVDEYQRIRDDLRKEGVEL